jgi:hypothetical protein
VKNEQNGAEKIISLVGSIAEVLGVFYTQLTQHGLSDMQALTLTNQLLNLLVDNYFDYGGFCFDDQDEDEESEEEE